MLYLRGDLNDRVHFIIIPSEDAQNLIQLIQYE